MFNIREIVDLGHDLWTGMPNLGSSIVAFWPSESFEGISILSQGRASWQSRMMLMSEHCGTHLDAAYHFNPEAETVDKIPFERLVLPGHLLDLTDKQAHDAITPEDLALAAEKSGRKIGPGYAVLAWTGQDKNWGSTPSSFPSAKTGFHTERPYLPAESAEWLVHQGCTLFGTDLIGIDNPEEWWNPTHVAFCAGDLPFVQQMCNLDRLVGRDFLLVVLPLKMRGGTASPVRPIALVE